MEHNFVADNTGLSVFIKPLLANKYTKFDKIRR